ncbi:MAG: ABC transporter permease subunit [Firmicutes bacterium]|nr:ABC transporter permease subunit [Alicyclobacillaceae bacterium]MCL6498015.1 ABC transporter permease subunit [Bacillota bacterium]
MRSVHAFNLAVERVQTALFWAGAALGAAVLAAVVGYLGYGAMAFLSRHDAWAVVGGMSWDPVRGRFGMAPFWIGSAVVAALGLAIAVPLGLGIGIWAGQGLVPALRQRVGVYLTVLSAVPSVVWGWWGLVVVVPALRQLTGGTGYSLAAGGVVLGLMVLPTFAQLAVQAVAAVPAAWVEGSLALGATMDQTLLRLVLPAAKAGLRRALWVALARALGETVAVQMVVGGFPGRFFGVWAPGATIPSQILTELPLLPPGTPGHGALEVMALLLVVAMTAVTQWAGRERRQ